ncbi:hypothetical protein AVEN_116691-1 [Araneus ventricosus]|uniref:Uncharacterized protein n=1 Tax=Araneus ventricosus TaxID=182803 RepID=A0A4Y2ELG1_ARAVE|nr:hypothetical protein AVEN_116691-1 [Araneus ventricosus]
MIAPLALCIKKEQQALIRFLWLVGAKINQRLSFNAGTMLYHRDSTPQRYITQTSVAFLRNRTCKQGASIVGHSTQNLLFPMNTEA